MAALTLIARGYTNVGFMGGPEHASTTQDRLAGFTDACTAASIVATASFATSYSFDAGRAEMTRLLRQSHAEAYFCGDDVLSIGALSAAQDFGLCVPRDLGLIGLNDMEIAGWANINLTTIRQPFDAIVRSSIELMVAVLADPSRPSEARMLPCTLIERGTLRPIL
jgi:DNA-binding LacI/PurR family transcriptional regulator